MSRGAVEWRAVDAAIFALTQEAQEQKAQAIKTRAQATQALPLLPRVRSDQVPITSRSAVGSTLRLVRRKQFRSRHQANGSVRVRDI
jgi:hypothetical protein